MYKRIIFDLQGVLYRNNLPLMFNTLKSQGIDNNTLKSLLFSDLSKNLKRGRISDTYFWNNFKDKLSVQCTKKSFNDSFKLNTEIFNYIKFLRLNNFNIDLCCDISEDNFNYLNNNGFISKLFDQKILSHKIGFIKEDLELSEYMLSNLECYPKDIIYINGICGESKTLKSKRINIINFDGNIQNLIMDLKGIF